LKQRTPLFWIEAALASFCTFLVLFTAAWPDWVEGVFGFDPDRHDGGFEWELAIVCCVLAATFAWLARRERRKAAPASS
jgi:hypothetical protein